MAGARLQRVTQDNLRVATRPMRTFHTTVYGEYHGALEPRLYVDLKAQSAS